MPWNNCARPWNKPKTAPRAPPGAAAVIGRLCQGVGDALLALDGAQAAVGALPVDASALKKSCSIFGLT
jgi:hypothetical protein